MVATNLTATGITFLTDKIDSTTTASTFWIGWGTGGSSTGGTATSADTGLKASATEAWVAGTLSQSAVDTNQFVATITAGTAKTVEEAGVFAGTATGSVKILIRASHGGVVLATGDAIQYTFTLQLTATA